MNIENIKLDGMTLDEVLEKDSRWDLDTDVACDSINRYATTLELPRRYAMVHESWWDDIAHALFHRVIEYDVETRIILGASPAVPHKEINHWILSGILMGLSNHVAKLTKEIKERN